MTLKIIFSFNFHKYVYYFQLYHSIPSPLFLFLQISYHFYLFLCVLDLPNLVSFSPIGIATKKATPSVVHKLPPMLVHGCFIIKCFIYVFSRPDPVVYGKVKITWCYLKNISTNLCCKWKHTWLAAMLLLFISKDWPKFKFSHGV